MKNRLIPFALLLAATLSGTVAAANTTVAVASNFRATLIALAEVFKSASGHDVTIASAASGVLAAQASHGAPYDIVLAADQLRPAALSAAGLATGAPRIYAVGRLTLISRDDTLDCANPAAFLRTAKARTIAIPNPDLAPYGQAATEVLQHLALWEQMAPILVQAQNVGQAMHLFASYSVTAVFTSHALAQQWFAQHPGDNSRSCELDSRWHKPITQAAVLLKTATGNPAAQAFWQFLGSAQAQAVIRNHGYLLPDA